MQGYASSYSIWTYLKNKPTEYLKPTAYKNINQRLLRLARIGLLEGEVKFNTPTSTHGRRDYKVTMTGLDKLIPHIVAHPEVIENVVQYIDKIRLDRNTFEELLTDRVNSTLQVLGRYLKFTFTPLDKKRLVELEKNIRELDKLMNLNAEEAIKVYGGIREPAQDILAEANEAAESIRQTAEKMKDYAPNFQETIRHTSDRKKKPT